MSESVRFRHKATEVLAIENKTVIAAVSNGATEVLPPWVKAALFSGRIQINPSQMALIVYPFPNVPRVSAVRDWLLFDPDDETLNCLAPELLDQLYDRLGE